jgi:hypothetical protein
MAAIRVRTEIFELSDLNVKMRGILVGMARWPVLAVPSGPRDRFPTNKPGPEPSAGDRNIELVNELSKKPGSRRRPRENSHYAGGGMAFAS